MKKISFILAIFFSLYGCAAPFSKFYHDQTKGADISNNQRFIISNNEPEMFQGGNQKQDAQAMFENGYLMIGYSSFNAGNVNTQGAIIQAKKVHASRVLIYSKYTNTVSGLLPLTLPNNQTSNTSFSGSVYGSGNYVNYTGNAVTTTYGTRTTYIPYNVNRSDFLATYWVKLKPLIFGAAVKDLTNELRREIQSNKGILISAVVKGSPAFQADIFKGDILKKIENVEFYDAASFNKKIKQFAGKKVKLIIYRNGKEIEKNILLNPQT